MYLKRLELLGFKSFPDKTVIKLTDGVTAVVGPNGCGKSNILDSIRWVLGEQKVSLLRGTKMEEIIFNGTRDLKPLGMAEVTLVIQNTKDRLPTEYGEVQITRRLFRSGDSEYLLNKVPCRLKDIIDLLMDTGVGAHAYSMIQQDMVDAILSDRTDERRFLFEEAAGISKYKNRKQAALRKLESTEQDLLRLKDIVAEVNTRVNSLKRQVSKAEKYKQYSDELKGWEIFLGKAAIDQLNLERSELLSKKDILSDSKINFDTAVTSLSAQQEKERKNLTDLDRDLTQISSEVYEKSEAAHTIERDISILREKKENARALKDKNELDIKALGTRKEILNEQIEDVLKGLSKLGDELEQMTGAVDKQGELSKISDEKVLRARLTADELNQKLMQLESQLSGGKSDDRNLKEQDDDLNSSIIKLSRIIDETEIKKKEFFARQSTLENELETKSNKTKELDDKQNRFENDIEKQNSDSDEVSGKIYDLTASFEAAEARRHLLVEMMAHYEGFGSGVKAALDESHRWPNLLGTVADNLIPSEGYEYAIEAALGETAGYLICRDRDTVDNIINYLREEKKGRAGFIILDEANSMEPSVRPTINSNRFLDWGDKFVSVSDELSSLAKVLLSRVAVMGPGDGCEIVNLLPPYFEAVTPDGKYFKNNAVVSGGSSDETSLLGRKEKVAHQEKIIADLTGRINSLKESRDKITAAIGTRQAELRTVILDIDSLEKELEIIEKDLMAVKYDHQTKQNDIARLSNERSSQNQKLEMLKNRQYNLNLSHDQLSVDKDKLTKAQEEHSVLLNQLEIESEAIEKQMSNLQIGLVEQRSKKQQLETQISHTRELISDIEQNSTVKSEEIIIAEEESKKAIEKMFILEKELKTTFESRTALSEKQTKLREKRESIQLEIDKRENEVKSIRQNRENIGSQLHETEIRLTEIDSEVRNIKENLQEECDINLDEIIAEIPNSKIPEEKRRERMLELKESIRNMGAVNLLALEEFSESSERHEFLSTQLADLLSAKSTLQTTITKINSTAKKLFSDTFDEVRGNFKKVFEELFTGGEADVRLTNPEEPLESPIEIIARPRGKKLLSIAQMSGGERALTAISLLFAIYLTKPSPFCVLDEVDAPLDDANIKRFLKLIKTFSDETQFIIITHNKLSMESAHVLYGITMENPGVSKVVSVRFDADENGTAVDGTIGDSMVKKYSDIPESIKKRLVGDVSIKATDDSSEI